jgi:adenosylcobinamide-GDP ribazoletransferase
MFADLRAAFAFLTILPVGQPQVSEPGRAFAYFPLVGAVIGLIMATFGAFRLFPPDMTAFLALATWVILTGGLHLDGFADSCDGLLATTTPERRLEIMKDPRAGSWAVIGIVLLLLGKWIALRAIFTGVSPFLLIVPPVFGRVAMTLAVAAFPPARTSGLAAYFREGLDSNRVMLAIFFATVLSISASVFAANLGHPLWSLGATLLIAWGMGRWAANRLGGGLTGDVYGAICELTELICLIILSTA